MKKAVHFNRVALAQCGAVLLCALSGATAQAGMFDDDEARKQIAAERKRIDDVKAQQQAVDARLGKIEEAFKSQALLDLFTQIEALKVEVNKLRGQIEVLNNNGENTAKRQRDMYLDLDTRVRRFEQQGAPATGADAPAGAVAPAAGAGAAAAPPAAATSGSAPAGNADTGAETRAYEAAQGQRRVGNYQGAIVAFQNFIKQYPKSNLAPRAQYWIGDSYFNLRDFKLAIGSQQALLKAYPESPTVPDAMLNIASSQIEMGDTAVGRRTLEELVAKFPVSEAAEKAKRRISGLTGSGAGAPATATAPAGRP